MTPPSCLRTLTAVEVSELLTEAAVGVPHRWPASTDRSSLNIWKYVIFKIIHKVKSEATELTINGHCVRLEAKKVIKKINIFWGVFTCCELIFLRVKDKLRWLVSLLLSLDRRDVSYLGLSGPNICGIEPSCAGLRANRTLAGDAATWRGYADCFQPFSCSRRLCSGN